MNEQADAIYQKALENQAQPDHAVLHEYRFIQLIERAEVYTVLTVETHFSHFGIMFLIDRSTGSFNQEPRARGQHQVSVVIIILMMQIFK